MESFICLSAQFSNKKPLQLKTQDLKSDKTTSGWLNKC